MRRLRKLIIHRYRNVQPGTSLEFGDHVNVLLGENGTGKTTLLHLIAMICRSDFSPLEWESSAVDIEYEEEVERDGVSSFCRLRLVLTPADRRQPTVEPNWMITGHFRGIDDSVAPLRFQHGAEESGRRISPLRPGLVPLIAHAYGDDPRSCAFIQWEPRHEGRFDEASDAFRALTDGKRGDLLTLDPFFCRVRDGSPELGASLLPRDLSKIFSISPPPPILSAHGSREDSTFPTLQQICQVLGLEGIIATPNLRTEAPDGTRTYDQWRFEVHWPNGLKHHHSGLSFGQKRLLAFLWYLGCIPEGPVITDELVNGFHHSWIETCLNIISERQAFMASQNPLLLDFLDFENAEEVRGSFVFCEKTVDEGEPVQWRWRNMDQAEAAAVYRAYKVGIQHVSNILQSKGLW